MFNVKSSNQNNRPNNSNNSYNSSNTIMDSDSNILAEGIQISSTLYEMQFHTYHQLNAIKSNILSIYDWHLKLGHLNVDSIKSMLRKFDIKFADIKDFKCEYCLMAKCTIKPFYSSTIKSNSILQLIHSDLSGIIRVKNNLNVKYFVVFIDDFSRLAFVYLLKEKCDVHDTFVSFKKWIELKTGHQIRALRSDNGGEYLNENFHNLHNEYGIELQYSTARRQQQNGVSERFMRTVVEMARSMLIQSKVHVSFWPFAISHAAFLRNRCLNSTINEIPFKKFFGGDPDINSLIPFGSSVIIKSDSYENKFSWIAVEKL